MNKYDLVIESLEMIKANLLDPKADHEVVEKINNLIEDLEVNDPIKDYEDMYCDTCGGTACHCG